MEYTDCGSEIAMPHDTKHNTPIHNCCCMTLHSINIETSAFPVSSIFVRMTFIFEKIRGICSSKLDLTLYRALAQ
jgi:hypothetical protein